MEFVLKMLLYPPLNDLMWLLAQDCFIVFRNYFHMLHSMFVVFFLS
jgi:hypothetical protein